MLSYIHGRDTPESHMRYLLDKLSGAECGLGDGRLKAQPVSGVLMVKRRSRRKLTTIKPWCKAHSKHTIR